jgi:hypothetical protein
MINSAAGRNKRGWKASSDIWKRACSLVPRFADGDLGAISWTPGPQLPLCAVVALQNHDDIGNHP